MLQTYISCIKLRRYWREKIAHGVTSLRAFIGKIGHWNTVAVLVEWVVN